MDQAMIQAKRERLAELNRKRREEKKAEQEAMLAPFRAAAPADATLEKLQFKHDTYFGVTYTVLAPSKEELEAGVAALMRGEKAEVTFLAGIARVNAADKDQYNRKIGRVVAASKLASAVGNLVRVEVDSVDARFTLKSGGIFYHFMLTHGRVNPFFLGANEEKHGAPYHVRLDQAKHSK